MVNSARILALAIVLLCGKAIAAIDHDFTISDTQVWQRQAVLITISLKNTDKYSTLDWPVSHTSRYRIYTSLNQNSTNRIHAILFFTKPGAQNIQLPDISYSRGGRIQQTISLLPVNITVKTLPAYIPPTMPVGKITMSETYSASPLLLNANTFYQQDIRLSGINVAAEHFPLIQSQLTSAAHQYLSTETKLSNAFTGQDFQGVKTYNIPLSFPSFTYISEQVIHWQYFDPNSGKILNDHFTSSAILATPIWMKLVLIFLLLALIYYLIRWSRRLYTSFIAVTRQRQQIKALLNDPVDTSKTKQAIATHAALHHWQSNASIHQWLEKYQQYNGIETELNTALQRLDALCYANSTINHQELHQINQTLLHYLHKVKYIRLIRHQLYNE